MATYTRDELIDFANKVRNLIPTGDTKSRRNVDDAINMYDAGEITSGDANDMIEAVGVGLGHRLIDICRL